MGGDHKPSVRRPSRTDWFFELNRPELQGPAVEEARARVLIADPDQGVLRALKSLPDIEARQVDPRHDWGDVFALAKQHDVVVAPLDEHLVALQLCRRLRHEPATASIGIVVTAPEGANEGAARALVEGADAVLIRPFGAGLLLGTLEALLRRCELESRARDRSEELQAVNARKSRFIAVLAHELRNPIGAISAAGEIFQELLTAVHEDVQTQVDRVLSIHHRQVGIASRIIEDLLDVAMLGQGRLFLKRRHADLVKVVASAVEARLTEIQAAGLTLELDLGSDDDPLIAYLDAARVEQIVANLLSNAVKYTPPGGHVWLRLARDVREDGVYGRLEVQDDGAGIPIDQLSLVFERFVQLRSGVHRDEPGLGLGLTLVRHLTEMHGGEITVASAGPGTGTTFTIYLPLSGRQRESEPPLDNEIAPPPEALCVLLVEDSLDLRELLWWQLENAGYEVIEAGDAETALELARARRPELALIDLGLPATSGLELASRLRAEPRLKDLTMISMSGYGADEDRERALSRGFVDHLVKPIRFEQLERVLHRHAAPS